MFSTLELIPTDLNPFTSAKFYPPISCPSSLALRPCYYESIRLLIQRQLLGFRKPPFAYPFYIPMFLMGLHETSPGKTANFHRMLSLAHHAPIAFHRSVYPCNAPNFPRAKEGR